MRQLQCKLELNTPMFLGAADARGDPVLRAAPLRGEMRYWLRALLGATISSRDELLRQEGAVFGDTRAGSPLSLRVQMLPDAPLAIGTRAMLPHRDQDNLPAKAFLEGDVFQAALIPRPAQGEISNQALLAFLLWLNLGGVGKRARRGFGSLRIQGGKIVDKAVPDTFKPLLKPSLLPDGAALADSIEQLLTLAGLSPIKSSARIASSAASTTTPASFPSFLKDRWMVLVCCEPFPNYLSAMQDFWQNHLRNDAAGLKDDEAYGHVKGTRRASPLHLHLSRSQAGLHLILTAFHSQPPASDDSWEKVLQLFESCRLAYRGIHFS